jgi:hypothetical protein
MTKITLPTMADVIASATKDARAFVDGIDATVPSAYQCDNWSVAATEGIGTDVYMSAAGLPPEDDAANDLREQFWAAFEEAAKERASELSADLDLSGWIAQFGIPGEEKFGYKWFPDRDQAQDWCNAAWADWQRDSGHGSPYCGVSAYHKVCDTKYRDGSLVFKR